MDCLRITGSVRLHGSVSCSGSKNAALPIMAASILTAGPVVLSGVPHLADVDTLSLLLGELGLAVERDGADDLHLSTVDERPTTADYRLVHQMRASFCVLGPLLARRGRAVVSLPGGCNIGNRPVDLHLAGLQALGAELRIERGSVVAEARSLRGTKIDLRGPYGSTVTGTANVMTAATLAAGKTVITGAASEPEIVDLGEFLMAAGADIVGLGTDTIEINGVEGLSGVRYQVIPDRIEAATLLIAAAITQGTVSVTGARPDHLVAVLEALAAIGLDLACGHDKITVHAGSRPRPYDLIARPYPGIPTDLQAQFMALLSLADGASVIADDVFPDRALHIAELNRFGASIERREKIAVASGVHRLTGAEVAATDLRASAALIIAGLAATGETVVHGVHHLDRGYERLEVKLADLGAQVVRETERSGRSAEEPGVVPSLVQPQASNHSPWPSFRPRGDAARRTKGVRSDVIRA
jgi:UDP-N-acetylglucosamine 1-carboxyvinyltransferase